MGKHHKSHWGCLKEECAKGTRDQGWGWGDGVDSTGVDVGCPAPHAGRVGWAVGIATCWLCAELLQVSAPFCLSRELLAALLGLTYPGAGLCALPCGPGHPYMDAGHTEHPRVIHNTGDLKCESILSPQCSRSTPATPPPRPGTSKFKSLLQ